MPDTQSAGTLDRSLGFWSATAINITQIVGAGVFLTVPLILKELPGWYGLLAWLVAGLLILCDGMIWAELGAALPAAGGSYNFLRESYGRSTWGRLMSFLFVWQILISGPLEVGSGLVAAAQFSKALSPEFKEYDESRTVTKEVDVADGKTVGMSISPTRFAGFGLGVLIIVLLYRRVATQGKLSLVFLLAIFGIMAWVLFEGLLNFRSELAFAKPPPGQPESFGNGLGVAMGLAIYSYLGYYNICYLGGEVRNPTRTIPRAILASALIVIVAFALLHLAFTSVIPGDEAVAASDNLTAEFMKRVRGDWAAQAVTVGLIGSCFVSAFSGMLGYSRVPYAAAVDGHFFSWFAAVHPKTRIPHRSLFLMGGLTLFWSFFTLQAIIDALIATRILEQFVAQIFAVMLLRKAGKPLPWRMWLYPIPCFVALCGWLFIYANTGRVFMLIGFGTLILGALVFVIRAMQMREWPFAKQVA